MLKYLFIVLAFIAGVLFWMVNSIGVPSIYEEKGVFAALSPHLYLNEDRLIDEIRINAVYFVPADREEHIREDWRDTLERSLKRLVDFHSLQFRNRSSIFYTIHPKPVVGLSEGLFYDTTDTRGGNPKALINVSEEFERRFQAKRPEDGIYPVLFIMYEGVGASGGIVHESEKESEEAIAADLGLPEETIFIVDIESVDGFFLVNRAFIDGTHGAFGESILVHEFYHTLGAPDSYFSAQAKSIPTSQDIMGLGRFQPLEQTYLGRDTLKEMGI